MRLSNGEVLLAWPLDIHVLTQGWYYNDGSLHQAVDLRTQIDNMYIRPVRRRHSGSDPGLGRTHADGYAELW